MKHLKLLLLPVIALLLSGCWGTGSGGDDDAVWVEPAQTYEAVTMPREAFEAAVQLLPPAPVTKSGKIYVKDNLLFVNDVNKGFHIYKYDDPSSPVAIAFLQVPGATDIAMRGATLYINQATDLITLVYANNAIYMAKRNENVFPQKTPPDGSWVNVPENEIITDFIPL
jgi:hypothetical protein